MKRETKSGDVHDAILVGSGTALTDDPALTCRLPGLEGRSPVRVVMDGRLRLPPSHQLVTGARVVQTWIVTVAGVDSARLESYRAAGAEVIQFDEPAFNAYTHLVPGWGVEALNRAVQGLSAKKTAVHICYGYGIQQNNDWKKTLGKVWAQYREILPALVESKIDQISLEFAGSRVPLDVLELVGDRKDVLVGAIDVASDAVETPEQVAAVIDGALKHMPADRIYPCTNCGMAPMNRTLAYKKLAALAAGAKQVRDRL